MLQRYGFRYTGIGDNGEECFYNDSLRPERIFVHPMFCSYSMDSSRGTDGYKNRPHDVSFPSGFHNEEEQEKAFSKLLAYMGDVTIKQPIVASKEDIAGTLLYLEEERLKLVDMTLSNKISVEGKKLIPQIYGSVISYQTTLSHLMAFVK